MVKFNLVLGALLPGAGKPVENQDCLTDNMEFVSYHHHTKMSATPQMELRVAIGITHDAVIVAALCRETMVIHKFADHDLGNARLIISPPAVCLLQRPV